MIDWEVIFEVCQEGSFVKQFPAYIGYINEGKVFRIRYAGDAKWELLVYRGEEQFDRVMDYEMKEEDECPQDATTLILKHQAEHYALTHFEPNGRRKNFRSIDD